MSRFCFFKKVDGLVASQLSCRNHWGLCQNLVRYMVENNMSQVEFAELLEVDQARVSEIVNHRIDKVSTDKLISYNEKIKPVVAFKIAR